MDPSSSLYATKPVYGMEESKTQNTKAARSCHGAVGELARSWQSWSKDHVDYQQRNPFSSDNPVTVRTERGDPTYGRPPEGSKTEQRGKHAHAHIGKEVEELCLVIRSIGKRGQDGQVRITFKCLFDRYVTISNKVVGVLLRARKHGLVDFEGEMLWQGKDDNVVITLLE
ncbi:actin-binding Rho-activating protein-like [Python bivittatus]|uniref:Actin-binding Rho-activating protein n=1 Tax=Python bivittatus TaxID=176946 RepID=A0A9F2R0P6_PYTBI|nr:actin-binding Rho-activating protein-like [Python bivittatus]